MVVVTGVWLSSLTDQIAAETGLGRSFVGALFLGVSTSLPEITASLAAVRIGAIDLAIGNVLGSNLFNVTMLAVYDVFDGGTNLWAAMNDANALGLIIAMMMTAVVIVSLMYRASPKTPWRISWDGDGAGADVSGGVSGSLCVKLGLRYGAPIERGSDRSRKAIGRVRKQSVRRG